MRSSILSFLILKTGSRGLERGSWMTSEVCTMFPFVWLRALSAVEEKRVILARAPNVSDHDVNALCQLAQTVRSTDNESDEISIIRGIRKLYIA